MIDPQVISTRMLSSLFPIRAFNRVVQDKTGKILLLIVFFTSLIVGLGFIAYGNLAVLDEKKKNYIVNELALIICFPSGMIASMFFLSSMLDSTDTLAEQLIQLRVDKKEITKKLEEDKSNDIFQTIQLSLNELNQYYTINKAQATTSFRISLTAIIAGLSIIIGGIALNYTGKKIDIAYIAGISGVLLEFIGGAYFFMYKKSLEQVNFFFGQLIKVQDTMLAISLAEAIKEEGKKIDMQEKIIVSLLERSLK